MIVHQGYEHLNLKNPVVTLGIFDGVHLGHKALIERLIATAKKLNGESVIITFFPHPRLVLSENKSSITFLTNLDEKIALLEKAAVNHLIIVPFDHVLSNKEACQFIEEVLVKKIGAICLVAGFNNLFGRKGDTDFDTIRKCAECFNIKVEHVDALVTENGIVSSTSVRDSLLKGEVEEANKMLGYNYFMNGTIVKGKQLGREIGFPTANIDPDSKNKLIPKGGVYAVEVMIDGEKYLGMMNIGTNPTVNNNPSSRTLEVNIFDFDKQVYQSKICVIFRRRLRDETRFESLSLLVKQLDLDKKMALRYLKG